MSVPTSWEVLQGNELRTVETSAGAAIDLSGYTEMARGTETLIVAGLSDPRLYASMTITSTAIPSITPSLLASLPEAQVESMDAMVRRAIVASQSKLGTGISDWKSLKRVRVGHNIALHASYLRTSNYGPRRVQLYKFFGVGRIYDLILSTSVSSEGVNEVVLQLISESFVAPGLKGAERQ